MLNYKNQYEKPNTTSRRQCEQLFYRPRPDRSAGAAAWRAVRSRGEPFDLFVCLEADDDLSAARLAAVP